MEVVKVSHPEPYFHFLRGLLRRDQFKMSILEKFIATGSPLNIFLTIPIGKTILNRSTFTLNNGKPSENICDEFFRKRRFRISANAGIGFFFSRFDSPPNVTSF